MTGQRSPAVPSTSAYPATPPLAAPAVSMPAHSGPSTMRSARRPTRPMRRVSGWPDVVSEPRGLAMVTMASM